MTTPGGQIGRRLAQLQAHATDHNCSVFVPDSSETEARACCHRSLSAELLARPATDQYSHVLRACRPLAPSTVSSTIQWDMEAARANLVADVAARRVAEDLHRKSMERKVLKHHVKDEAKVAAGGLAIGAGGVTTVLVGQGLKMTGLEGLTALGEGLEVLGASTVEIGGIGVVIGVMGMGISAAGMYEATH